MALASPPCAARTYRERLLDGSWCPSAPRHRREKPHDLASLTPRCRPRSARFGGVEGALHGSEDSPYSARIRRAPLTSQGTQRPGRRIAGRKGIPEHVVNLVLSAGGRLPRRRQTRVSFRRSVCARRAHHAARARHRPSTIAGSAMGLGESNRRAGTVVDGTALRFPARPRSERRLPQSDADWRCRQAGGCRDVGRLRGSSGAHRDGPADGRNGRVSGIAATSGTIVARHLTDPELANVDGEVDLRRPAHPLGRRASERCQSLAHCPQLGVPSREGRRRRIRGTTRRAVGTRADLSAERCGAPRRRTRAASRTIGTPRTLEARRQARPP